MSALCGSKCSQTVYWRNACLREAVAEAEAVQKPLSTRSDVMIESSICPGACLLRKQAIINSEFVNGLLGFNLIYHSCNSFDRLVLLEQGVSC
jgi:hypothetical protein